MLDGTGMRQPPPPRGPGPQQGGMMMGGYGMQAPMQGYGMQVRALSGHGA